MRKLIGLIGCIIIALMVELVIAGCSTERAVEKLDQAEKHEREAAKLRRQAAGLLRKKAVIESGIGINLNFCSYYDPSLPFLDRMKQSNHWSEKWHKTGMWGKSTGRKPDVDQFGNIKSVRPETVVSKLVLRSIPGAYPGGKYVVTYDGGTIVSGVC